VVSWKLGEVAAGDAAGPTEAVALPKGQEVTYHCIRHSKAYIKTFCPSRRMLKTRFGEVTDRLGRVQFL